MPHNPLSPEGVINYKNKNTFFKLSICFAPENLSSNIHLQKKEKTQAGGSVTAGVHDKKITL